MKKILLTLSLTLSLSPFAAFATHETAPAQQQQKVDTIKIIKTVAKTVAIVYATETVVNSVLRSNNLYVIPTNSDPRKGIEVGVYFQF